MFDKIFCFCHHPFVHHHLSFLPLAYFRAKLDFMGCGGETKEAQNGCMSQKVYNAQESWSSTDKTVNHSHREQFGLSRFW